jgi:uncharacterized protein YecE (DUF72 family)
MEFGKLESVDHVDWTLPSPDPRTRFYIGAPASEFLFHYARNFNCIELNTTHYQIPTRATLRG